MDDQQLITEKTKDKPSWLTYANFILIVLLLFFIVSSLNKSQVPKGWHYEDMCMWSTCVNSTEENLIPYDQCTNVICGAYFRNILVKDGYSLNSNVTNNQSLEARLK